MQALLLVTCRVQTFVAKAVVMYKACMCSLVVEQMSVVRQRHLGGPIDINVDPPHLVWNSSQTCVERTHTRTWLGGCSMSAWTSAASAPPPPHAHSIHSTHRHFYEHFFFSFASRAHCSHSPLPDRVNCPVARACFSTAADTTEPEDSRELPEAPR